MFVRGLFILILGCFWCLSSKADVVLYDDSKGLSSNEIIDLVKDNSGWIWIATSNGLNVFDGYSFDEIKDLKGISIRKMYYDSALNQLWVIGENDLFIIRGQGKQVIHCRTFSTKIVDITCYNGTTFLIYEGGYVIGIGSDFTTRIIPLPQAYQNGVDHVAHDKQGNLFFSVRGSSKVFVLNLETQHISLVEHAGKGKIWKFLSGDGQVWIIDDPTGYRTIRATQIPGKFITTTHTTSSAWNIYDMGHQRYGVDFRGYYRFEELNADGSLSPLISPADASSLRGRDIKCVIADIGGVLWVGTRNGLLKFTSEVHFPFVNLLQSTNQSISVRELIQVGNQFYVASYRGIFKINPSNQQFEALSLNIDSSKPSYARALLYDELNGKLLVGTESHRYCLFRYDLKTKKFEYGFYKYIGPQIRAVYSMLKDQQGDVWAATDKGLAKYRTTTNTLELYTNGKFSVGDNRLYYLSGCRSRPNCFWVAGRDGFWLVDIRNGIQQSWTINSATPFADDYLFIGEHSNQTVWIGSKKSGLLSLDMKKGSVKVYTKSDGLPSNEVYGVLWQNDSVAWVSTSNGLSRMNVNQSSFYTFYQTNGLSDNEFNQHSLFASNTGMFYLGSINGITSFNPNLIQPKSETNRVFVSSISKWNKKNKTLVDIERNNRIELNADDYSLTFNLGLSDYAHVQDNQFYYRIHGVYDVWTSLGNQNTLRLEGLSAGEYPLEIMGINKHGQRSVNMIEFSVVIGQEIYKTWWFYIILSALLAILIYGYFKWRIYSIHKQQELRTQIASNLHDEVGSLLTHIAMSSDSARYSAKTLEDKNKRLENVSGLARLATRTMSDVLWSIDARNDFAGNLTDRMREQAESMFNTLDMEIHFEFSLTKQNMMLMPKTRQQLYFMFKEALNNIVKHSHAKNVWISYSQWGVDSFELLIKNDDVSPNATQSSSLGQGLKNMQMRSASIGARFFQTMEHNCYIIRISKQ